MDCEKIIPSDILVDLCSRFVINVPEEEQSDLIRICFQVELAHWFYIDFYSKNFPNKRPCGLREFTLQVFKHIPYLQPFAGNVDQVIEEWKDYKYFVPTFGAILLDEDLSHVLLVQNYKSCWGFPKGKVNKDEPPHQCAIREVYEETGFDISNLIDPNDFLEVTVNERVIRLYVIPGVSKSEKFVPKTRNEIKAVSWFPVSDIPLSKKDAIYKQMKNGGAGHLYSAFYMVSPFMRKLWQWIYERQNNIPHRRRRERHKSCSDIDKMSSSNINESVEILQKLKTPSKNQKKRNEVEELPEDNETCHSEAANSGTAMAEINLPQKVARILNDIFTHGSSQKRSPLDSEMCSRITVSSDLESYLTRKRNTSNSAMDQISSSVQNSSNPSHNPDESIHTQLSITSGDSAFKKVEKSQKQNKRKRGKNKNFSNKDSATGLNDGIEMFAIERQKIKCIPSLLNFQFDISLILESMNSAIVKNESSHS